MTPHSSPDFVWQKMVRHVSRDLEVFKKRQTLLPQSGIAAWFKKACLRFKGCEDRQEGTLSYRLVKRSKWICHGVLNGYGPSPLPPDLYDYRELEKGVQSAFHSYQQEVDAIRTAGVTSSLFLEICAAAQAANMRIEVEGGVTRDNGISGNIYTIQEKVEAHLWLRLYTHQPYSASSHLTHAVILPSQQHKLAP